MSIIDFPYNDSEYKEINYALIPAGNHRVRIDNAEIKTSSTGKNMVVLTLAVSGFNSKLWRNIIIDQSTPEAAKRTNQWLGEVFRAFDITPGDLELDHWLGKTGGAKVKHSTDNKGEQRAEVHYFLRRSELDKLPAWQEGSNGDSDSEEFDSFYGETFDPERIPF